MTKQVAEIERVNRLRRFLAPQVAQMIASSDAPDALLATTWEGKPISREHGGPVRLVIPKLYFWKSAKWIKRIEFSALDKPGFWEVRGYHNYGDPWLEQRYDEET